MRPSLSAAATLLLLTQACSAPQPGRAAGTPDTPGTPTEITALEEQLRRAIVASDTATLAGLWAPEYLSTSAIGHTSNRAESLMAYGGGLVNVDTAVVRDVDVRFYGGTAVSLGVLEWAGSAAGRPFAGTVRFQHVWARTSGGWQLVASQLTNQGQGGPR